MIALPANTRIWIAAGVIELRRGITGLSALVRTKLKQSPFSGHVFVFRGRRGGRSVLTHIADRPVNRIEELLPWNLAAYSRGSNQRCGD